MSDPQFLSFFQGGFECSTHRRKDGKRLDVIAATRHDVLAESDYRFLRKHGIRTVRDGLRWHLIEQTPYSYVWKSFLPMLKGARTTQTQVIWDLFHYGWPDGLDIWSSEFVDRFAAFAAATARIVRDTGDDIPFYVPINEISFTAWAGGQFAIFNPFARGRGDDLKRQLVRASIAGADAIKAEDPRARIVQIDPVINVVPKLNGDPDDTRAQDYTQAQFAAWDMLTGRIEPELGGDPRYLDIMGINYYVHNQWSIDGGPLELTDPRSIPLRHLLQRHYNRYQRPLFIAETGIEAELRPSWLRHVCDEVWGGLQLGLPINGICLYPVLNHPGWDDDRHCPNGLVDYSPQTLERFVYAPLAEELDFQAARFANLTNA